MKFSIDKIEKMIIQAAKDRAAKEEEIRDLEEQLDAADAALEAEADAGNLDEYLQKQGAKNLLAAKLHIAEKQLDKIKAEYTSDNVKAAWNDFAADHNKTIEKKLAAYQTARKDLYNSFMELVTLQNVALAAREKCARLIGKEEQDPNFIADFNSVYPEFPLTLIDLPAAPITDRRLLEVLPPDQRFFLSAGLASDDDVSRFDMVVRKHHSY